MGNPPSKSAEDKVRIVLAVLRGEISIAAAAALCLALALGCSALQVAAPSEDAIVVPPTTSVLDLGDTRSAPAAGPGVDEAPVRSSTPEAGPAPAPTTTDAERHPTPPTEAASPTPTSTEAAPPAPAEPDIDQAGTATEPAPPAYPNPS